MTDIIAAIAAIFGTTGFGALIGGVGGLVNRWVDFKTRSLDIELKRMDHDHEIRMRDIDVKLMGMETEGKVRLATVEGEAKVQAAIVEGEARVEAAGYAALSESYKHDTLPAGVPIFVVAMRAVVRPLVTVVFLLIVSYANYKAWSVIGSGTVQLTSEQTFEIIRWTLFQASVIIGWWFAMRPSGDAGLRVKAAK